jgi:hypothetical protein
LELPIPAGLGTLNASLDRLADFLRLSRDLIAAAAEASSGEQASGLSQEEFGKWILSLPNQEKDMLLLRLVEGGDPHLMAELRQRAKRELRGGVEPAKGLRRTAGQIRERAEILAEEERKIEAEKQARDQARRRQEEIEKRKKHLKALSGKEEILWVKIEELIATKQMKRYDEAVSLLQDLRDLADLRGRNSDFSSHLNAVLTQHLRNGALMDRVRRAKLQLKETVEDRS